MPTTLKAHFDGEQILLDEPADLPIGVPLLVTVLASQPDGTWHSLSQKALARAYGEDEPHYSRDDLK